MKDKMFEILALILLAGLLFFHGYTIKMKDKEIAVLQQNIGVLLEQHNELDRRIQNNQNALIYFDEELKSQGYDGYYQYKVVE